MIIILIDWYENKHVEHSNIEEDDLKLVIEYNEWSTQESITVTSWDNIEESCDRQWHIESTVTERTAVWSHGTYTTGKDDIASSAVDLVTVKLILT